ncbi:MULTISPECIES: hypothetical protein [unclassified Microcoleus]|uniref:hypothetical protein n=1 Tax=unclassified Microcoleus TaxID=2642155 RepID=UPI002FD3B240
MALPRPRLQLVQNDEIVKAIETIRKHRPGLINDSMVATSALVEYALTLESDKPRQTNYQTPYGMTIVKTGHVTAETGIFNFLIQNLKYMAAIFAHIDNIDETFIDYVSRGGYPVYTFVFKGKGFTDFEFVHIATQGSYFEECLTLLVLDFKHHREDIRFNVIHVNQFEERWGKKFVSDYVPSLDEMAKAFFQDENYLFGGEGGRTSCTWGLGWEADTTQYQGFEMQDTRYVDYSRALVGLKPSSLGTEKYGVAGLVRSGVLSVDQKSLHLRFRCMCDGWVEEQQYLDFYELGRIFTKHFGYKAIFSPASFLSQISPIVNISPLKASVYAEKDKRIEVLPMNWEYPWFTCIIDGKASDEGMSLLRDNPNPFRLYDMNDFFPDDLERYKQKKKTPKQ